jgi:tetratricopeptide (TPR) repeat protein
VLAVALAAAAAAAAVALRPSPAAAEARHLCFYADPSAQLKDIDRTIAACTSIIASHAQSEALGKAYSRRAMMFSAKEDWKAALADSDRAVELLPKDPYAIGNRGVEWLNSGHYDKAIADLTTAIQLSPRGVSFFYNYMRGQAYLAQDSWDEALADFRQATRADPTRSDGPTAECLVLAIKNQDLSDAAHMCGKAIQLTRNYAVPYENRALVYLRQGKPAEALADAQTALGFQPDDPGALFVKALAELRLGRAEAARADLASAEAHGPGVKARYARWGFAPD